MTKKRGLECNNIQMTQNMRGILKEEKNMEKERLLMGIETLMKVNGWMTKLKDLEFIYSKMDQNMKEILKEEKGTEKVSMFIVMETIIKVGG